MSSSEVGKNHEMIYASYVAGCLASSTCSTTGCYYYCYCWLEQIES